ncbi:MAG TPA: DVU3141 family protein, partial [Polyangiaceae bacterium]|nr:DVU3141 family protein [Polyangiaceae bacterium]
IADANDTGRALPPASQSERELLQRIPQLPVGPAQRIGDDVVVADAAYTAASGRTCRALQLTASKTGKTSHRVACNGGGTWFFVPDVFGGNGTD